MNTLPVVIATGAASLLLQVADKLPVPTEIAQPITAVRDFTLTSFCIVVIYTLWGNIKHKDNQINILQQQSVDMAQKVTQTMTLVLEAVKELRITTDKLVMTIDETGNAMDNLTAQIAALPCSLSEDDRDIIRHNRKH